MLCFTYFFFIVLYDWISFVCFYLLKEFKQWIIKDFEEKHLELM